MIPVVNVKTDQGDGVLLTNSIMGALPNMNDNNRTDVLTSAVKGGVLVVNMTVEEFCNKWMASMFSEVHIETVSVGVH